jgi:hypothetical protein
MNDGLCSTVKSLPNAYERANREFREAQEALELLQVATAPELRAEWEADLAQAQKDRLRGDFKAMDVLQSRLAKGRWSVIS